jgi:acyl-CoA reductase-like NAD-dependent aldehyde dehydrogenase
VARRLPELGDLTAAETGKPRPDAYFEAAAGVLMLEWASRRAKRALRPRSLPIFPMLNKKGWVEYSPRGVIGVITPFNFPAGIPFQSIPWILAAGNTVVLKPSELTPRTGEWIGEVFRQGGLDLVTVVQGEGDVGAGLVASDLDGLVFTGSVPTGRRIAAAAGERLMPVVLELGGKDAMVVCDDADLERASAVAVGGAFINAGQACQAIERILVHEKAHDAFVKRLVERARAMRVGPADDAHVGAVTQPAQIEKVRRRIDAAVRSGARIAVGGEARCEGDRWYFEPTILVDVPAESELFVEESFLPVVSVVRVRSDDEAAAIANRTEFGLNGSVFSANRARARRLASAMQTGGVNINDALQAGFPSLPFGGEKASGMGRLQGDDAFRTFSRAKTVVDDRLPGPSSTALVFAGDRRPSPSAIARGVRAVFGGWRS